MSEATWGDATKTPHIDWRVSAALENVPRGGGDIAEVTSLEDAVRTWIKLDPEHKERARLTVELPLLIDGVSIEAFEGAGIEALVERLPTLTAFRPD